MSKIILLLYFGIIGYIWVNALSELIFDTKIEFNKRLVKALSKFVFAPFWIIGVFSETGRKYLFNFSKTII